MGQRGTDVPREATAPVLLEARFAALVAAVGMGRRLFGNLRNAVGYLIAVHVPIVGVSLLPVLLGGPPLLLPLHVVLLELIIDPAGSLVFEAEPTDCMRQPPQPVSMKLLSLIAGNLLLLVWYRHGERLRGRLWDNRAFQWLLAGVAAVLALAGMLSSLVPSFGLPAHPAVTQGALALGLLAAMGAGWLWAGRARASSTSADEPPNPMPENP